MRRTSLFGPFSLVLVTLLGLLFLVRAEPALAMTSVFINEIHYDNAGTDTGEAIEIAGPAGTDLSTWSVVLYNGSASQLSPYDTIPLSGTLVDQGGGCGTLSFNPPGGSIQNGAPDGLALVNSGTVIQFLSYEGSFTAGSGPASGMTSVDIGVSEGSGTAAGTSMQLTGSGSLDTDFSWTSGSADNFGVPNSGQTFVGCTGTGGGSDETLLMSEIVVTPTGGEFVEIHNPTDAAIDLSDVYLSDATFAGGSTYYYNLPTGTNAGGGGFADFNARFPDGASIGAGEYQTVSLAGSDGFVAAYGIDPTYELFEDGTADAIPDMREATAGSINGQGGLTNGGEFVVLYSWDGASDLVQDLDYMVWGDKAEAVDKTGVSVDGPDADTDATAYAAETAIADQDVVSTGSHVFGNSWQREDISEGAEANSGGNGATGHDETSEDSSNTWCENPPTPNLASDCTPPPAPASVVINEIHADPAADITGDANNDGTRNGSQDEFVELVNISSDDVDMSGWTISDAVAVRHTFPAGSIVPAGCAMVVFGGGTPTGVFGSSVIQTASEGFLGFNNGGDSVTVQPNDGSAAVSAAYGGEGNSNQSLTLDPDVTGANYVQHTNATGSAGALFSPGTQIDGAAFANCGPTHFIHDVQGNGAASPIDGAIVTVEGIIVGDHQTNGAIDNGDLRGFFLQEEDSDADGDTLTSEGIFVFDGDGVVDVMIGDRVSVTGRVDEFNGLTELTAVTRVTVLAHGQALPTASVVTLPLNALTDLEMYENMYISMPQSLTITEFFNFDRFGEIVIATDRQFQPTAIYEPGSPEAAALADLNQRSRITLDDGRTSQNPDPALHPNGNIFDLTNTFRGGDLVTNVTGVINYSFGLYRVQPTQGADYVAQNPRTTDPEPVGGSMQVASFNVLNYFTTIDQGGALCGPPGSEQGCRGADNLDEFNRQRTKIIAALAAIDADVVGLIEIENNETESVADLVSGLNDLLGAGTYAYIDTGYVGTDAIKVAIIYKPDTVIPYGAYAVLDSSVDARFDDSRNRPALAQTFVEPATGGIFTVVVNHLKSKGSGCGPGDDDPEQGNCNLTRTLAAQALVDWFASDPTGSNDPDFIIMGDLNAYDKEDPIDAIVAGADDIVGTSDDYVDLLLSFGGEYAYSYVFSGELGYLDHALANLDIFPEISGTTAWHINSDEPDILDYDTSFKQAAQDALYEPNAYRASDHDPVIIGLDLNGSPVCSDAQPSEALLWPPNHKYVDIDILGVTDPEGDTISINIDAIFQDEAVDAEGSGNTAPDGAGINSSTAQVRAERVGNGNGRVYSIQFTATDDTGNTCSSEVTVGVPKNKKSQPYDDGQNYDSTIDPNATTWLLNSFAMMRSAVVPANEDWLA